MNQGRNTQPTAEELKQVFSADYWLTVARVYGFSMQGTIELMARAEMWPAFVGALDAGLARSEQSAALVVALSDAVAKAMEQRSSRADEILLAAQPTLKNWVAAMLPEQRDLALVNLIGAQRRAPIELLRELVLVGADWTKAFASGPFFPSGPGAFLQQRIQTGKDESLPYFLGALLPEQLDCLPRFGDDIDLFDCISFCGRRGARDSSDALAMAEVLVQRLTPKLRDALSVNMLQLLKQPGQSELRFQELEDGFLLLAAGLWHPRLDPLALDIVNEGDVKISVMGALAHVNDVVALAALERLLERGVDLDAPASTTERTVLWFAAREGRVDLLKRLLLAGADPGVQKVFDRSCMSLVEAQRPHTPTAIGLAWDEVANMMRAALARRAAATALRGNAVDEVQP